MARPDRSPDRPRYPQGPHWRRHGVGRGWWGSKRPTQAIATHPQPAVAAPRLTATPGIKQQQHFRSGPTYRRCFWWIPGVPLEAADIRGVESNASIIQGYFEGPQSKKKNSGRLDTAKVYFWNTAAFNSGFRDAAVGLGLWGEVLAVVA